MEDNNIPVQRCVQQPGEFIITYPFGYHAGYNLHFNCAESVNFALDSWLEIGRNAKSCSCIDDSVTIDVNTLLANNHDPPIKKRRKIDKPIDNTICILCPSSEENSILYTNQQQPVHKICAESINEVYIKKNTVYGIGNIPASRWKLVINIPRNITIIFLTFQYNRFASFVKKRQELACNAVMEDVGDRFMRHAQ